MALVPPVISTISLSGTTATIAFTADALATDTTFYLLDPATGAVLLSFPGIVTPTAVLAGLNPQQAYDVVAVSFTNPGPSDFSPPSLSKPIRPEAWDGVLKTLLVWEPVSGARCYEVCDALTQVVLVTNWPYHWWVDPQIFADEKTAVNQQYTVRVYTENDSGNPRIVKQFRTNKALCLITGQMNQPESYGGFPNKIVMRPKGYRVQPIVQRSFQIYWDAYTYPNYLGQWGLYLMSGTVIEVNFFDKLFEFVVPYAASAELVDLPLVDRSLAVKNT